MRSGFGKLILIATALTALAVQGRGVPAFAGPSDPAGGTQITSAASATWQDSRGNVYHDESNQIVATVQGIGALAVTPKETSVNTALDGYPAGQNATRTFVISNASNISDAYRVTSLGVDKGSIVSAAFVTPSGNVPIAVGSTVSPAVAPGASISVQVVVATTGIAVGTGFALHMTAQTTNTDAANGLQSDSGEQWLLAAAAASFAGPDGANTPIVKTVNHQQIVQSQPQSTVSYDIVVKNYGGSPATNAVVTDVVPDGLTPDVNSVTLDGISASAAATLSGQTLAVKAGTIAAGQQIDVGFTATIADQISLGSTFVNIASVSADGVPPMPTTPASVFIGTADIVFDPSNNNAPVSGATVSLLDANEQLVRLDGSSQQDVKKPLAILPQSSNTQNPYTTGSDGAYGFALAPSQIAAGGSTFYLTISRPGYLNRRIKLFLTPDSTGMLYSVAVTSNDGQPIAKAGAYALTDSGIELKHVFGLFGNLPLFKSQTIAITKTVNQSSAQPGDRLIYALSFANTSGSALGQTEIVDTLPPGEAYGSGTARLDGSPLEPAVKGRALTWSIPSLAAGVKHTIVYATVVFPSVPAGTVLSNSVTASANINGTLVNASASASADVQIVEGALTDRSIITGRVFVDVANTGHFRKGDRGVPGVRIYLEDGTSVLTDAQGRFSFPAARPGEHVLRLDATTLPSAVRGKSPLQRLVHGLLDDGLMQDVEFAVSGP